MTNTTYCGRQGAKRSGDCVDTPASTCTVRITWEAAATVVPHCSCGPPGLLIPQPAFTPHNTTSAPGEDDLPHHSWSNITALTWLYLQVLAKVLKSGIWRRLYKWVVGKCEIWYIPSLYFIINARKIDIDRNALYVKCHVQCLHVLCRIIKVLCFGNL